jgi:hypothetical protein
MTDWNAEASKIESGEGYTDWEQVAKGEEKSSQMPPPQSPGGVPDVLAEHYRPESLDILRQQLPTGKQVLDAYGRAIHVPTIKQVARPAAEVGSLVGGGVLGAPAGPGGSILGAGLLYGAVKKSADLVEDVAKGKKKFKFGDPRVSVFSEIEPYETTLPTPQIDPENLRKETIEAKRAVEEGLAMEAGGAVAGRMLTRTFGSATAKKISKKINANIMKALKPTVAKLKGGHRKIKEYIEKARTALGAIAANRSELHYDLGAVKGELPQSISNLHEAIDQTKKVYFKDYDKIARATGEKGARVVPTEAIEALRAKLDNKAFQTAAPDTIKYIESVIKRLEKAGGFTPLEAQETIALFNQTTKEALNSPTIDTITRAAVDSEANFHLKRALFEVVESHGGAEYKELRQVYGALTEIEGDVARAVARDMSKGAKGLIDFSDIFTSYVAVESLLTVNPSRFAAAGGARTTAAIYKYWNNPNTLVKGMFKDLDKLTMQQLAPIQPAKRQLVGKAATMAGIKRKKKKPIPPAVMKKKPEDMPF